MDMSGPDGRPVKKQIRPSGRQGFLIEYIPHMAGRRVNNPLQITCSG